MESGKVGKREGWKAGQVRYWQNGQAGESPNLAISDLSRFPLCPASLSALESELTQKVGLMGMPRSLVETILPLTNSRGFGKFLRFNYRVGSNPSLPLVVSPQILSMANPYLTRQALYFLSDLDCAIRMYSEEAADPKKGHPIRVDQTKLRTPADDCLFEYSLRQPASRLTTRSELPPRRTRRESIHVTVKKPGCPDASYISVDGERVLLSIESQRLFEDMYDSFVADLHDPNVGQQAIGKGVDAYPPGLCSGEEGNPALVFQELPYTFEEVKLLSSVVPVDPEMIGRFSVSDLLTPGRDESSIEAIVALLNQPYIDQVRQLPPGKFPDPEIINVRKHYDPRLLDFYFAGLRSLSPVVEYKNYYNIIEFYFEDVSLDTIKAELDEVFAKLKEAEDIETFTASAKRLQLGSEQDQIRRVVSRYITVERLRSFFHDDIPEASRRHFESFNGAVNGWEVQKIRIDNSDLQRRVADRIYSFRNAVFHSKRTLKGKETMVIRPCSKEETEIVAHEVLLIKMVAQEIVKQE